MSTEIEKTNTSIEASRSANSQPSIFSGGALYDNALRMAKGIAASEMIPKAYQNNVPNIMIAFELANRIGESPLMVMQNMNPIHGKPTWGSSYLIGRINSLGRFSAMEFEYGTNGPKTTNGTKYEDLTCIARCTNLKTGKIVESMKYTVEIAVKEGWYTKNNSKWPVIPQQMLSYRCASAFASLHAPEIKLGMPTREEVEDYGDMPQRNTGTSGAPSAVEQINAKLKEKEPVTAQEPEYTDAVEVEEEPAETPYEDLL